MTNNPFKEELDHLENQVKRLVKRMSLAFEALNKIASWEEGPEVGPIFDCPYHAEYARKVLAELDNT